MPAFRPLLPLLLLASTLLAMPCRALELDDSLDYDEEPALATASAFAPEPERAAITHYLRAKLGEPYRLGATGGRDGFDCSGLVLRAYEAAGLAVPRLSAQQFRSGVPVPLDALKAGDLLFYQMKPSEPDRLHVVVYIGEGRAIHASVKHNAVREIDITRTVWSKRLVAARSLVQRAAEPVVVAGSNL